ncbi:MAG: pyruvate kinase [Desulfobacteraceae bacterium]|jgi:pyruvate kinase|nr:pyruvate kinase [Desulfobacteraceae bacterium]
MKKTKVIATISNHMCDIPLLEQLFTAGMNVVRMNTAHQTLEEALKVVQNVRAVSDQIALMIDTKGPEIRITEMQGEIPVKRGDIISVKGNKNKSSSDECLFVNYDDFVEDMSAGDKILIDDGDIELCVIDKNDDSLTCEVRNDGAIKSRKGVNLPSVKIKNLPSLSEKDKTFIAFAAEHNIEFIAHSFVRRKEDILDIQKILDAKKSPVKIIAKIENQEGVDNIDEILDHCFGVMVARGDLAIEIPAERIPIIQKKLVRKCIDRRKPVIIATQMLQSMVDSPRPTRAEVSDVANACLDHTDAIMLSGETANGKYPVEAVKMMTKIAVEVESSLSTFIDTSYESDNDVTGYLSKAAVKAALRLNTKALIADSISGKTILSLAAYRGENMIYAFCYSKRVMRELAVSFGVRAYYMKPDLTSHEFLETALTRLLSEDRFKEDSLITVLAGNFGSDNGASYVEISTAKNLLKRI